MRRGVPILVAIGSLLSLQAGGRAADNAIVVTNFGEMEPVVFNHDWHARELGCETCHHVREVGKGHRCGACHLGEAKGTLMKLEDAAHKEGVGRCWKCHLSERPRKALSCESCHRG